MEKDSATSFPCHASGNDTMSCSDGSPTKYFEFSGLDLLRDGPDDDDDASDSSYSSYCNDSLQLSGVPRKTMEQQQQQQRSSIDGAIHNPSVLTMSKIQRSASVAEMTSWLSTSDDDCEDDDLDVESSYCLAGTKLAPLKNVDGKGQFTGSFTSDILASQAVAGGAGRAA